MTPFRATLVGLGAIGLWATLAVLTTATGKVPPLQLNALTFAVGGILGLGVVLRRPEGLAVLRQPWRVWALGVGGLCGYHALYFAALRLAPPAEAGLINYLWPLLIVLFSGLLPGEHLRWHHVCGAGLGLAGVVVVAIGAGGQGLEASHAAGYGLAAAAALVWAGYSVLSRRFSEVPTAAVAGYCLATALISAALHAAFEASAWPSTATEWLAVLALGCGPVGAAFFLWDIGMKRGDIRILGAVSYLAPLLSTLLLILSGRASATGAIMLAGLMISGGALIASKELFSGKPRTG